MNQADTAWMLTATAPVLLMTPALAFFYGGLKNIHWLNHHVCANTEGHTAIGSVGVGFSD